MIAEDDYSVASGGVLWRLIDRSRYQHQSRKQKILLLSGLVLICWLPLAVASFIQLGEQQFYLRFIRDIGNHVRFLFVLPLYFIARTDLNNGFRDMAATFYKTKILDADNAAGFEKAKKWILKWSHLWLADLLFLVLAYALFYIKIKGLLYSADYYVPWLIYNGKISFAGWWYLLFSLPFIQVLTYRWIYVIILWIILMYKISAVGLHLSTLHPDRAGGLGFLRHTQYSFIAVAIAFSSLLAAELNNMVIFSGVVITENKALVSVMILLLVLLFTVPLFMFIPGLVSVKRNCYLRYSAESWCIARDYERELKDFSKGGVVKPDTSGHSSLISSFEKSNQMNVALVNRPYLLTFLFAIALPFLPVLAQQLPLHEVFIVLKKFIL
jgi:hypothetical protein